MDTRRKELGDFLMAVRKKCPPQAFGFPQGQRRRTEGLRREEVAQLTGISPTWYTWIEQGRDVNISADALDRLARALRMERSQRAYLFELAGRRDPRQDEAEHDIPADTLQRLVENWQGPAYVLGQAWDVLGWNAAAEDLFEGWLGCSERPNLLRYVFLDPAARTLVVDWESRARRLVAEFRADCSACLDDPVIADLLRELTSSSEEFARFWKQHDVLERQGGERRFRHSRRGVISLQQMTLSLVDHDRLKVVVLMPEG